MPAKFEIQAESLFAFLKQTFSKMPGWVQVIGWFSFLLLFVILVLYPLFGITYFQGQVIKRDQSKDGRAITPPVASLRVHHDGSVITNNDGEFTIPVRGPILPMTSVKFSFGDGDDAEQFLLPAPLPFISLFNPNSTNIYYSSRSPTTNHYFLKREDAEKAYQQGLRGPGAEFRESRHAPFVVHAAAPPAALGFLMRIRDVTLSKGEATSSYFVVSVNGQTVPLDNVPNADSPSARMVSFQTGKPVRIENFDIPIGQGSARVKIDLLGKRLIFKGYTISSGSVSLAAPTLADIGQESTAQVGILQLSYEILPQVGLYCTGIVSKSKNLHLVFWIDTPPSFLDTITGVQYDLGPSLSPGIVSFPTVTKSNNWAYEIVAYSPQVIRGKVIVRVKDSVDVSTLCDAGRAPNTAMGYYAQARAYAHEHQFDLAVELANQALHIDPEHEGAATIKADGLAALGKFDLAADEYKRLAARKGGAYLQNGYAWFLVDRFPNPKPEQLREAKKLAEEAVHSEPSANNLDTLGWANYKLSSYKEAEDALQRAKALLLHDDQTGDSGWQELHYHLGSTLVQLNRRAEAIQAFTEVVNFQTYLQSNPDYVQKAKDQLTKLQAK